LENLALPDARVCRHSFRVSAVPKLKASRLASGDAGHLALVECRATRSDRPYPETHDAWAIAVVRRGSFAYRAGDTNHTQSLHAGWLLLGRARVAYECSHSHDAGDDCLSLQIAPRVLEEVATATPGCKGSLFPRPVVAPVTRVGALVERLAEAESDFDETAYAIASALLSHLHETRLPPVAPHATHRARVDEAIARIEGTCHAPLSLADLAADAGLSPFHFLRVFRRVTGTTPHQYVLGARLRRAARLLLATSRPVTEIAYEVGFEDLSNFIRTFHRAVGASPSAFRKRAHTARASSSVRRADD